MALCLLVQWSEGAYLEEPWEVTVVEEVVMADNSGERVMSRPFARWPVDWSAVWVGALSAAVVGLG